MTTADVQTYLSGQMKISKVEHDNPTVFIDACIRLGLAEFWNCRSWSFRSKVYDLTVTTETDSYDLPNDFEQYRSVVEKDSLEGYQLRYLVKEEFDKTFPRQDVLSASYPRIFTLYRTGPAKYKIQFMPQPMTGTVIHITYCTTDPPTVDAVPRGATGALLATIEKYLYPINSPERANAVMVAEKAINDLENRDSLNGSVIFQIFTDEDYTVDVTRPWL